MSLISSAEWEMYKQSQELASTNFNKTVITHRKYEVFKDRFGEDPMGMGAQFVDYDIECNILSNYFRSWPMGDVKVSGEIDEENATLIIHYPFLRDNDMLTPEGYFDFDPARDEFIIKGRRWKAYGDIDVSYAHDEPMYFWLILKRYNTETGNPINP